MYHFFSIVLSFFLVSLACGQKQIAITIDDVPNAALYRQENYSCRLLRKIDSLQLPATIFINEKWIYGSDSSAEQLSLFKNWILNRNISLGNHGYSHAMYSAISFDVFKNEVLQGEKYTLQLAGSLNKPLRYFRFPYNDLGATAEQHQLARDFLASRSYTIAPFTVHSDDWMLTELYALYKERHNDSAAQRITKTYISKTLEMLDYIESLTSTKEGRQVKQIYLMHDNLLNADCLPQLLNAIASRGYGFISMETALQDPVYAQPDYYQGKEGISWVYRWIKNAAERNVKMQKSPNLLALAAELKNVKSEK